MSGEPTPSSSSGARFGNAGYSERLARSQRGDPRLRRAQAAARTADSLGAGIRQDADGKPALDYDAATDEIARRLEQMGFKREGA